MEKNHEFERVEIVTEKDLWTVSEDGAACEAKEGAPSAPCCAIERDEGESEGVPAKDDLEDACDECRNLVLARKGEAAAAAYLERRGAEILEMNWKCPFGEADIICEEDGCLVFVEVKTRSSIEHGLPAESVTAKKRAKYERIAACYLRDNVSEETRMRFDVIGILVVNDSFAMIRHYVNAFGKA